MWLSLKKDLFGANRQQKRLAIQSEKPNSKEFNEKLAENQNDLSSDDEEVKYNVEEHNRLSSPISSGDDDGDGEVEVNEEASSKKKKGEK